MRRSTRDETRTRAVVMRGLLPAMLMAIAILVPAARAHDDHRAARKPVRAGEDFTWSGRVAPGRSIEIKDVNGDIRAETSTGSEVEVVARKSGRKSDPAEVSIEVIEHDGGVTLCAIYPTPKGQRPNRCAPGDGGRMSIKDNDVKVEFTVRVPAGVRFVGRTVNGNIEAHGLKADVEAITVNGSIGLSTRGMARATTVNGSIRAEIGAAVTAPMEFETVNGGVTLTVPSGTGAELHASTVNGDISFDIPLLVRSLVNRRTLSGTIGNGGPRLGISTVNGSIRLRSAS